MIVIISMSTDLFECDIWILVVIFVICQPTNIGKWTRGYQINGEDGSEMDHEWVNAHEPTGSSS